jgi:hypothetical protein
MKKKFFTLLLLIPVAVSGGGKHDLSSITGTGIDLKTYDHAFAGSIKDFVVWAAFDESTFSSYLIARKYGQLIRVDFKKDGKKFGGSAEYKVKGKKVKHTVLFKGIDPKKREIRFLLDEKPVTVKITSGNLDKKTRHLRNPSYSFPLGGKKIVFKINSGDACFGLSAHYSMLILMAWAL